MFDLSTGKLKTQFRGRQEAIHSIFSPEDKLISLDSIHSISGDGWIVDRNGTWKCWVLEASLDAQASYSTTLAIAGGFGLFLLDFC